MLLWSVVPGIKLHSRVAEGEEPEPEVVVHWPFWVDAIPAKR